MLKVLLVENETLDRVHLKTLIDWEAYDYQLVGEAENGGEALALIASLHPDIVITDIRMPVMNGLELMAACPPEAQKPEFLIMSGYDDYDLVRRGLTLGAYDYLRKLDVNQRSLLEALGGIRARIGARRKDSEPDHPASISPASVRNQLLAPIFRGQAYDEDDLTRVLGQQGIVLLPQAVYCGLIRIDGHEKEEGPVLAEAAPWGRSVLGITEEILRDSFYAVCTEGKPGQFIVFASSRVSGDEDQRFEQTFERLLEMLSIYLNLEAQAGIGFSGGEPQGLRVAYDRASAALKSRFFFEGRRLILWKEVPAGIRQGGRPSVLSRKEDLRLALDTQRKELLKGFFDRLQEEIGRLEWSATSIKEGLIELNYLVREYFEANQLDSGRFLKRSRMTYEDIGAMQDVGEARRWIKTLAEELTEFLAGEAKVEYSRVVMNTKRYVAEHFGEDLTLSIVAVQACLSPNYFSSIFKLHSGMSFSEYLNNVRISAAKQLLAESDLLIYEVAEKCGYHDSFYFNRVFKKMTGISPGAYKKLAVGGD